MNDFNLEEYLASMNSPGINPDMQMPVAPDESPRMPASTPPPMNPMVKESLIKKFPDKFDFGEFSDENRKKLQDETNSYDLQGNTSAALASLGAAFQGRDSIGAANSVLDRNQKADAEKLAQFDKGRANKVQDYSLGRQVGKDQRDDAIIARESDPESTESKLATQLYNKMGGKGSVTASQFKQFSPTLKDMYEIEQKRLDRQDARADARMNRDVKNAELSSTQAKQLGLYQSGVEAENQYENAVKEQPGVNNYDPTSSGQFIDNSEWAPNWLKNNKAIEAQNAQAAWVESYLRDASGAAIPPDERMNYAKDFFPRGGDTEQVVKNKERLRAQKMENARIASGPGAPAPRLSQSQASNNKDQQAMAWAQANPKDPRAKKIIQLHGG